MIKKVVIIGFMLLFIIGCSTEDTEQTVTIDNPFISGTEGLEASFENLRMDVRDNAQDPFDLIIKLQNLGETKISAENIQVKVSGINPDEFQTTQTALTKKSQDDSLALRKTQEGDITPSPPLFIEFLGLSYEPQISGTQITFPLKADICYKYQTDAVGKLCIRTNILNPETKDGICEVTGDKTIYSSGAPVQIANLKESARSQNKIGFTFEIINGGEGYVYEKETSCDKTERQKENKVYVTVDTKMAGLTCIGLTSNGNGKAEGYATLYSGSKIISCTQETPQNDFEQVINIASEYDYEISRTEQIIVKSSGI